MQWWHVAGDGPAQLAGGRLQAAVDGGGKPGVGAGEMTVEVGQQGGRAELDQGQRPGAVAQLRHLGDG